MSKSRFIFVDSIPNETEEDKKLKLKEIEIEKYKNGEESKDPVKLLERLEKIQTQEKELEKAKNLILRDLRMQAGKSFRLNGHRFQIRRRRNKFFLCDMDKNEQFDLSDHKAA